MSQQSGKDIKSAAAAPEQEPTQAEAADPLFPGDFYMDGPYLVFTEAYHLRRGYCCNSGCRHCPYEK